MNFYMIFLYEDNVRNKNSFIYSNLNKYRLSYRKIFYIILFTNIRKIVLDSISKQLYITLKNEVRYTLSLVSEF